MLTMDPVQNDVDCQSQRTPTGTGTIMDYRITVRRVRRYKIKRRD
eukprot:COSAG02_NODE_10431_length_1942_cov_1.255019_1_plen_44_part_10